MFTDLGYFKATIKAIDTLEHQPTVWPVPDACAQPYHPGSDSHGQLFRLCTASSGCNSRRAAIGLKALCSLPLLSSVSLAFIVVLL